MSDNLTIPNPIGAGPIGAGSIGYRPPRRHQTFLTPEMTRRLMVAGGILGALVIVVGLATWFSRSGGEVPVIQPDDRPIRVKPDDPGGLKIAGLDNGLYADGQDGGATRLAPAPEAPDPVGLRTPPEPRPITTAEPAGKPEAEAARPGVTTPQPNGSARPPATPRAATPQAAGSATAPTPNGTSAGSAAGSATPKAPGAASPAAAPGAKPASGRVSVQLVAVQSEGAAQAEWQALRQRHPDLFGARQAAISRIDRDGKTFWRVRSPGFADLAEARAFCERVRAKGAGCAVAEF